MTFTIRIRTQPGAPILCEYECPNCGRFEHLMNRDENGDPPSTVLCTGTGPSDEGCGGIAELVVGTTGRGSITYWSRAPVPIGRASKSDEWDPRALDTRPLAEGKMTQRQWKKWQRDLRTERRHQKKLKSGRISKRIQVGGRR